MNQIRNEKGYALLLVMLMVVLFTILGMGLLAMNMNAAKQFNTKEEQIQARHLAEMGLLHYKSKIDEITDSFVFEIDNKISKEDNLRINVKKLCNLVEKDKVLEYSSSEKKKKYESQMLESCGLNANNKVEIKVTSKGTSQATSKVVEGTIKLTPPIIQIENKVPIKPVRPPGYQIDEGWDKSKEILGYTEINGPFSSKKEKYHFMDSFVVNKIPDNYSGKNKDDNTFQVNGGKSDIFIVDKNLYIDGNLHIQNHACIFVKGDLTINGPVYIGTQSEIIVFGNAYIKGPINYQGNSNLVSIKVGGKASLGSSNPVNQYNWNENIKFDNCGWPSNWPNPDETISDSNEFEWTVGEKMNPIYVR